VRKGVTKSALAAFDRDRQHQTKREVILHAAASLFRTKGFAHTSLEDIAAALGVTKPTIYYYFASKQEILYRCLLAVFDAADQALTESIESAETGREALETYFHRYLLMQLQGSVPAVPLDDARALSADYFEHITKRRKERRDRLRAVVADGIKDGSIVDCDPKVVVSTWAGATTWVVDAYSGNPEDAARIADDVRRIFLWGLTPPDASDD